MRSISSSEYKRSLAGGSAGRRTSVVGDLAIHFHSFVAEADA